MSMSSSALRLLGIASSAPRVVVSVEGTLIVLCVAKNFGGAGSTVVTVSVVVPCLWSNL